MDFKNVKFFRQMFFIICLSSCLYQMSKICEIYFSYKTTTSVSYGDFSVISLPAITVCFDKIDVLKDEYLILLNISRNDEIKYKSQHIIERFCGNHTIEQQFAMVFNYKEIFK